LKVEQKKNRPRPAARSAGCETRQGQAELEESLKRVDASRQDAINLTEYQKKELSEVETRQSRSSINSIPTPKR